MRARDRHLLVVLSGLLLAGCSDPAEDAHSTALPQTIAPWPARDTRAPRSSQTLGTPLDAGAPGADAGDDEEDGDDILPDQTPAPPAAADPGAPAPPAAPAPAPAPTVAAPVNPRLWPKGVIAYTVDGAVADKTRITDAIAHWQSKTAIRFVARSSEAAYVTFTTGTGCSSHIGRQGAQQFIRLGADCPVVAVIHEIGHTVGLFHEHARADRDQYVKILTENISSKHLYDFDKQIDYTVGSYHYDSVMHYWSYSFSRNVGFTSEGALSARYPVPSAA